MEVSYRKHLYLPAAMEVHPVNDQAHGKMEQWAPDSEKMQAELEGNRMSKTLNVSPAQLLLVSLDLSARQLLCRLHCQSACMLAPHAARLPLSKLAHLNS